MDLNKLKVSKDVFLRDAVIITNSHCTLQEMGVVVMLDGREWRTYSR